MRARLARLWGWAKTFELTIMLTINIFLIIMAVLGVVTVRGWAGVKSGRLAPDFFTHPSAGLITCYAVSVMIGISIVVMIRLVILAPLEKMVDAMQRLAGGDFSVRMQCGKGYKVSELRRFVAAFNTAAEELGSTELLRRDFISNFSHEFKTPITSIGGFADLLLACGDELPAAERAEYLGIISKEAHRLAQLATNVLQLSRIESQAILTGAAAFDLAEQLRQCILSAGQKWEHKQLQWHFEGGSCLARGREDLLCQVWTNILDNACKFSPAGGRVSVALAAAEGRLAVTIADEGPGMDAQTQKHIFDRFYQGDTSHAAAGNGLGLALAKQIVALHQGAITVQSAPGEGSRFTVTLPL